ncbi:fasciclin domain-containing protein [Ramlibacter rhizophilus]|uniref:Fasciclin domain-containing protein n=1 Tax=Ramlibacter rhizophilus TaxID=1781167 RepID=A0A4Z0BZ75_9BURK|nr:fasciclin domain-containing protein [Ramlibacter rhizophilus]TFZ03259.1 fasciclin domain-containing protein [Ramlibacter rhizophilus]
MDLNRRTVLRACALVPATSLLAACGGGDDPNVLGVVQAEPRLGILESAVAAAGLGDTLSGTGPFTLFAPTDAAFAGLLTELGVTQQALLADTALLRTVLTYHVLPARVPAAEIPFGQAITTVQGGIFKIDNGPVITDGRNRTANVVEANLFASNGVVHVIDRVLLPANQNIVQTLQQHSQFSTLVAAAQAAGLVDALSAAGPFTLFAPTDAAFTSLLAELGTTAPALLANTALLDQVLRYHVVQGRVLRAGVPVGQPITTLEGDTFTVGSDLAITDARGRRSTITATDTLASNGVIHTIGNVLLPL